MTLPTPAHLMSAQHDPTITDTTPAGGSRGEEVKAMSIFHRRTDRRRAWDDLSEIDRAVLVEAVRQRREAQEHRREAQQSNVNSSQLR